jgi:hypothetical protein
MALGRQLAGINTILDRLAPYKYSVLVGFLHLDQPQRPKAMARPCR